MEKSFYQASNYLSCKGKVDAEFRKSQITSQNTGPCLQQVLEFVKNYCLKLQTVKGDSKTGICVS